MCDWRRFVVLGEPRSEGGIDISPKQIELANRKASDSGVAAEFFAADIYDIPRTVADRGFDLVFTGGGAIVWLPDLNQWADIVYELAVC